MFTKLNSGFWLIVWCCVLVVLPSKVLNAQDDFPHVGEIDTAQTNAIAWSPTGEYIATAHFGGFSIWNGHTGELVGRYPTISASRPDYINGVFNLVWKPDGKQLAVRLGYTDIYSIIQIIVIPDGTVTLDDIAGGEASGLAWHPTDNRLAVPYTQSLNGSLEIRILDTNTGEILQTLPACEFCGIQIVHWSPDGTKLAADYAMNTEAGIIVWDMNSGEKQVVLTLSGPVHAFDWRFDSSQIAAISEVYLEDGTRGFSLSIWDVNSARILRTFDALPVHDLAWHPSEDLIGIESDMQISIIDANTGTILHQTTQLNYLLNWKPDGSMLATMGGSTPLFFTRDGLELPQFPIITGLRVMNAATNAPVARIQNGGVINLDELGDTKDLIIQVFPNRGPVQSVTVDLNGTQITDNDMPYAIPLPDVGTYTLTATPYTELDAQGTSGTPLTVTFEVIKAGDTTD